MIFWGCGLWRFPEEGQHSATTAHRALPVCEWPALGMPWVIARSNTASAVLSRCYGAYIGAAAGLGRWWFVEDVFFLVRGDFQRRRQHSATTAHRALLMCEWPTPGGIPWATSRSNAARAVRSRCGALGAAVGLGRWFMGCLWRFLEEEAALNNHSAKSPASV